MPKSRTRSLILLLICLGLALASCISLSPQPTATEADAAEGTNLPNGTATPVLDHEIHSVTILPGAAADQWRVVGLVHNLSEMQVEEVRLSIQLLDSQGQMLAESEVPSAMHFLDIDEESPFASEFILAETPASAEVELLSFEISEFTRPDIDAQIEDIVPIRTGGASALGEVINSTFLPIYISAVPVIAFNAEGEIVDYAMQPTFISALGPRQDTPLSAVFQDEIPFDVQVVTYPDAVQDDRRSDNSFELQEPTSIVTPQGKLVLLVEFQNVNWQHHQWLRAVLLAELEGEVLAVAAVNPPGPIAPGEMRAFAVEDLPGLQERLSRQQAGIDELSFEIVLDLGQSVPVDASVIPLTIHIEAYEAIGSSIFIQGSVANETSQDVHDASLMASLRNTEGRLRSAGGLIVANNLESGESVPFTLALDIPAGENIFMLEFDLVASGLNP